MLDAWWIHQPPQCDYEPMRPYTIEMVRPGRCGRDGSLACIDFIKDGSCRIMVVVSPYMWSHIRHEKAHCNCPAWTD